MNTGAACSRQLRFHIISFVFLASIKVCRNISIMDIGIHYCTCILVLPVILDDDYDYDKTAESSKIENLLSIIKLMNFLGFPI